MLNGDNGDVADDHYHRWADDVALIKGLGLQAYRFSLAWPRIQPGGSGAFNPKGIEFYSRLVDGLLESGVQPVTTLYHWDLPQELEDAGGWANRETALRFADFAEHVAGKLGDRISVWTTLNEPWCSAFLGYGSGVHAPGRTEPRGRTEGGASPQPRPRSGRPGDPVGARRGHQALGHFESARHPARRPGIRPTIGTPFASWMQSVTGCSSVRCWTAPTRRTCWQDTASVTDWSFVKDGDEATVAVPLSVLGINYYSTSRARRYDGDRPEDRRQTGMGTGTALRGSVPTTSSSWRSPARTPRWAGTSTRPA